MIKQINYLSICPPNLLPVSRTDILTTRRDIKLKSRQFSGIPPSLGGKLWIISASIQPKHQISQLVTDASSIESPGSTAGRVPPFLSELTNRSAALRKWGECPAQVSVFEILGAEPVRGYNCGSL